MKGPSTRQHQVMPYNIKHIEAGESRNEYLSLDMLTRRAGFCLKSQIQLRGFE